MVKRTAAMLSAGAMEAVKTLISLLQSSTSPSVRLGAARAMLELSVRLREAAELHERITALEQRVERD
jgi:HEAT repeat protein